MLFGNKSTKKRKIIIDKNRMKTTNFKNLSL